ASSEVKMDDRGIDAMAARLERLERENRRWRRWAGAAAIVAATALVVIGIGRPRVVEAQPAAPRGAEAQDPAALVEEQLKTARAALRIIDQTKARGALVSDPVPRIYTWSV